MQKTQITKLPTRSTLQKTNSNLRLLAGSSMSNWSGPRFEPTEMVIPGGLDLKEKFYYALKGKFPKSVLERWIPSSKYTPQEGDQVVTANISSRYIEDILDEPHDFIDDGDSFEHDTDIDDIF